MVKITIQKLRERYGKPYVFCYGYFIPVKSSVNIGISAIYIPELITRRALAVFGHIIVRLFSTLETRRPAGNAQFSAVKYRIIRWNHGNILPIILA